MSNILWAKVKFSRNLKDIKFTSNITKEEQNHVLKLCLEATTSCGLKGGMLSEISDKVIDSLLKTEMIETQFVKGYINTGYAHNKDVAIQINGENHLEIISKDKDIFNAYSKAKEIDKKLCNKLNFAYNDKYGFLSPNIQNIGSGMNIEVKILLPALAKLGDIKRLPNANEKLIFKIDCLDNQSGLCLISTTTTLGYSEKDICELTHSYIDKIIKCEIEASKTLAKDIDEVKDKYMRAKAILNNCIKITAVEAYNLLGDILIGINAGIENNINIEQLNKALNCIKLNENNYKLLALEIQKILN